MDEGLVCLGEFGDVRVSLVQVVVQVWVAWGNY